MMMERKVNDVNGNKIITKTWGISFGLMIVVLTFIVPTIIGGYAVWRDVREEIRWLRKDIESMHKDPWCKTNDMLHMEAFARENQLKVVPHVRYVKEPLLGNAQMGKQ